MSDHQRIVNSLSFSSVGQVSSRRMSLLVAFFFLAVGRTWAQAEEPAPKGAEQPQTGEGHTPVAILVPTSTTSMNAARTRAEEFMRRRDYSAARKEWEAIRQGATSGREREVADYQSLKCLLKVAPPIEFESAVRALQKNSPGHPALDDLYFLLAKDLYSRRQWKEAQVEFARVLELYPESSLRDDARIGLEDSKIAGRYESALALQQASDWNAARGVFLTLADQHPLSSLAGRCRYGAAVCLMKMGRLAETAAECAVLLGNPRHAGMHPDIALLRADSLDRAGNYAEAAAAWESFVANWPQRPEVHQVRKRLLEGLRFVEPAFPSSSELPDSRSHLAYLAWLAEISERNPGVGSIKALTWLERFPAHPRAHEVAFRAMKSLRQQADWRAARELANQIVAQYPDSETARKMGGSGGRTEDQAALAFAGIDSTYRERSWERTSALCDAFLSEYPNNWRLTNVLYFKVSSQFHAGKMEGFTELAQSLLARSDLEPNEAHRTRALLLTALIRLGKADEVLSATAQGNLPQQEAERAVRAAKLVLFS